MPGDRGRWPVVGGQAATAGLDGLGVTMALGAYLLTQMTANSLNVYVSNQFFFWFLMAAGFQPRRRGGTGN